MIGLKSGKTKQSTAMKRAHHRISFSKDFSLLYFISSNKSLNVFKRSSNVCRGLCLVNIDIFSVNR